MSESRSQQYLKKFKIFFVFFFRCGFLCVLSSLMCEFLTRFSCSAITCDLSKTSKVFSRHKVHSSTQRWLWRCLHSSTNSRAIKFSRLIVNICWRLCWNPSRNRCIRYVNEGSMTNQTSYLLSWSNKTLKLLKNEKISNGKTISRFLLRPYQPRQ